jgi:uncharacterized metal-binding protein
MQIDKNFAIIKATMGKLVCLTVAVKGESMTTQWYETVSEVKDDMFKGVAFQAKCHMISDAQYEVVEQLDSKEEVVFMLTDEIEFERMLNGNIKI